MEKSSQELEKSAKNLEEGQMYVKYNLQQFVRHFNKYYSQLSNAVEDMRAEVSLLRGDTYYLIEQITSGIEEGEVCYKCGAPLI